MSLPLPLPLPLPPRISLTDLPSNAIESIAKFLVYSGSRSPSPTSPSSSSSSSSTSTSTSTCAREDSVATRKRSLSQERELERDRDREHGQERSHPRARTFRGKGSEPESIVVKKEQTSDSQSAGEDGGRDGHARRGRIGRLVEGKMGGVFDREREQDRTRGRVDPFEQERREHDRAQGREQPQPPHPALYTSQTIPNPSLLLPLLLSSRPLNSLLKFQNNPRFWAWMYAQTFDTEALFRRWRRYQGGGLDHRYSAVERFGTGPGSTAGTGAGSNPDEKILPEPSSVMEESETLSTSSSSMASCTHGRKCTCREGIHLLNDPTILANEYKERMSVFRRYRLVARGSGLKGLIGEGVEGVADVTVEDGEKMERERWREDIWVVWWMFMEHDERNFPILEQLAQLRAVTIIFYKEIMLEAALQPGYPVDTPEGAILAWIANRLGIDMEIEETREQIDTKVFIVLPYVFGVHKYQFLFGPWVHRDLPLTKVARDQEELKLLSRPNAFMQELSATPRLVRCKRLGKWWNVCTPMQTTIKSLHFMQVLERHPELITLGKNPHMKSFAGETIEPVVKPSAGDDSESSSTTSATTARSMRLLDNPPNLTSIDFDMELNRAMNCFDPVSSPGMHPLAFRHHLEGTWKGKYLYFDYNAYQHMVKGDVRSLYEGTYGEEVLDWTLEERVINVKVDQVGGDGSMMTAGYKKHDSEDDEYEAGLSVDERGWEPCLDENAPDRPGWTKEILLSGTGKSSWGETKLQGRVRAWDGLVTIHLDFGIPNSTGKWLYRFYVHAGMRLMGRYRDTFTPENMRGYEGPVILQKYQPVPIFKSVPVKSPVDVKPKMSPIMPVGPSSYARPLRSSIVNPEPSPPLLRDTLAMEKRLAPPRQPEPYLAYPMESSIRSHPPAPYESRDSLIDPSLTSISLASHRARLMAAHRANLAAQPILAPLRPPSPSSRLPRQLPPIEAPQSYRRTSYIEADQAQRLWSRSLASDIGSRREQDQPHSHAHPHAHPHTHPHAQFHQPHAQPHPHLPPIDDWSSHKRQRQF